jgi:hypothetical protein
MNATLYVYVANGFLADILSVSSATNGIAVKREDNLVLTVIFHDGTAPVELPADAAGSFVVKAAKHYDGDAVAQAGTWTKQACAEDGYVFSTQVAGAALDALLGTADNVSLMCEVSWTTGGARTTSPTAAFTVLNNLTR